VAATVGAQVDSPLQPAKDVNTGDHSEAMLHKLDDFKKLMAPDRLGFLYERWRTHPCADPARKGQWGSQPVYGQGMQEREDDPKGGLWQLKVINWGFMWDARGRLDNLHTSAEGLQTAADQVFQKIHAAWTSKAGDAAAGKFNDLRDAARAYAQDLETLGSQMEGAWRATRHAVEQLADFPNKSDVGGKPIFDRYGADGASDDNGNESRGDWSRRIDEIDRALRNGTARWGVSAHEVIPDDTVLELGGHVDQTPETVRWAGQVYLTDGDNMWADQACHWLDDLTHCYFLTIGNFRRRIEEAVEQVKTAWDAVNSKSIALVGDPFGKLSLSASQGSGDDKKNPDDGKKNPNDSGGDRSGNGSTGTGSTGTGSTGNGSTGTGSTPLPPVQPPPMPPVQPVDDTTSPSDAGTDPLVDPPPGLPQDQPKDQETVTIQDGDRKISVQSPDGEGHVKVTVDDGTGKPKTYDLDFGAGTGAGTGTPAQPGQTLPGQPDDGRPQTLPAQETPPGQGTPAVQEPADPVQQVQAGPDGKAVVQDGNLTITAERPPGTPDQVKITIDDGTGKPTTYVVDYSDPSNPSAAQQAGFTGQPVQGGRPAAEAYPAGDPLTAGPRVAQPASFAEPVNGGFADPATPQQAGFTEPLSAEARGFAQQAASGFAEQMNGGFADSETGRQSDFAGRHAEPVDGGAPSTGTSTQGGFTEPVSTQSQGFAQPAADPAHQAGFAEPVSGDVRRFVSDAATGQQTGSLDALGQGNGFDQPGTSTAPQSAGFTEPLAGGFADEPAYLAGFDDQTAGFTEPADDGFATEPAGQPDEFTDPAARPAVPDPAIGGFQPAVQPDVFDQAAAQAIDGDQATPFDQGVATAQASGFAAGPSIGDDLFRDWSTGLSDSDIDEYQSPETAPFERSEQLWTEPEPEPEPEPQTEPEPATDLEAALEAGPETDLETEPETEQPPIGTSAQSLGFDLDTADDSAMDSVWSTQGDLFEDSPDTGGEQIAPAAGEAGLAAVPDNGAGQPPPPNTATSAGGMGGMPMMGMGGAGGGGNTDQERGPSAWRTAGDLFDDGPLSAADRISTVLGDDER
jgi:hypothetical protein